jgi:Protein of unknown function (DUF3285)
VGSEECQNGTYYQSKLFTFVKVILVMSDSVNDSKKDSYVKLAMRNMVRKGGTSLKHFGLTIVGLLAALVGLAYLTR